MKVGVCEATELKKRSEMLSIPFADLLWGYAVEDLMLRVSTSAYREFLWLMSLPLLGEEAYRQRAKKRIRFFYKGSEEELTPDKLQPGQRLSRKDHIGAEVITTFDLRMTSPNEEPVMNTAEVHTIEHLGATFLRNHPEYKDKTVYFGPMGCRTGFYLLLAGDLSSKDIVPLMVEMFEFIRDYKGEVPGASPKDCGNYLDMNLGMANYLAKRYLDNVLYNIDDSRLVYPE